MSYNFTYCPICGRPVTDNWCVQHMKLLPTTDDLTETEKKSIRESVRRDGYYSWADFQWEQLVDS